MDPVTRHAECIAHGGTAVYLQVAGDDRQAGLRISALDAGNAADRTASALQHKGVGAWVDRGFDAIGHDVDIATLA